MIDVDVAAGTAIMSPLTQGRELKYAALLDQGLPSGSPLTQGRELK